MSLSDAVVVAPGGIGTLLELFYSWQLVQVHQICETPIILYGDIWTTLIKWMRTEVQARGLVDRQDMHHIFHLTSIEKVLQLIRKIHQDRAGTEHVCMNYNKYRVEYE
jgi:predicted Rossmann-fold nucleotide-binding protein